jgi:heme oxygenase
MPANLMETLKESTSAQHNSAEGSEFQSLLTAAKLPQDLYADYLAQLLLVHSCLEGEIKKHTSTAAVVSPLQFQEEFLKQDLAGMGKETGEVKPLTSTAALLDDIALCSQECPEALLGMHYVLLGSKHGGKFIARNVQTNYGRPTVYFDPYGPAFMSIWREFKERMNTLELSESVVASVCVAASKMFQRITEIGNEMMPRRS